MKEQHIFHLFESNYYCKTNQHNNIKIIFEKSKSSSSKRPMSLEYLKSIFIVISKSRGHDHYYYLYTRRQINMHEQTNESRFIHLYVHPRILHSDLLYAKRTTRTFRAKSHSIQFSFLWNCLLLHLYTWKSTTVD